MTRKVEEKLPVNDAPTMRGLGGGKSPVSYPLMGTTQMRGKGTGDGNPSVTPHDF